MCASVSLNVQLCKILTDVQIPPRGKPRAPAWEAEGLARRLKPQPNRLDVWKFCISNSWWNTWGMERKLSLLGWVGSWRMEALQRGLWGPGDLHNCCMWLTILDCRVWKLPPLYEPRSIGVFLFHLQVHNQASEWWINQQDYQEHAAVGLSCYHCLPHNLLGGDATLLTDVGAQNVFLSLFFFSFGFYFLLEKKKSYSSALFYNAKCYCYYERLFLCQKDVAAMFSMNGHVTVAATESIVFWCF